MFANLLSKEDRRTLRTITTVTAPNMESYRAPDKCSKKIPSMVIPTPEGGEDTWFYVHKSGNIECSFDQ
jgi:hypothetical protein